MLVFVKIIAKQIISLSEERGALYSAEHRIWDNTVAFCQTKILMLMSFESQQWVVTENLGTKVSNKWPKKQKLTACGRNHACIEGECHSCMSIKGILHIKH